MEKGAELLFRATHDSLTGISNRGMVLDTLRREHSRQVRGAGSFGIILLDIDHFKNVNDTYGHQCGDAVLQEVARIMTASVRAYDTVGRYGGEEFLIVVPSTDAASVFGLSERIRHTIAAKPIATGSGEISITVSLGLAVSSGTAPLDPEAMLGTADEALYRAKEGGRNRSEMGVCEVAPSPAIAEVAPVKAGSE